MIETYAFGEKLGHARPAIDAAMQKMAVERPEFRLISADVARGRNAGVYKEIPQAVLQYRHCRNGCHGSGGWYGA